MTIFDNANMLKEGLGKNGLTKTKQRKSKFSNFLSEMQMKCFILNETFCCSFYKMDYFTTCGS